MKLLKGSDIDALDNSTTNIFKPWIFQTFYFRPPNHPVNQATLMSTWIVMVSSSVEIRWIWLMNFQYLRAARKIRLVCRLQPYVVYKWLYVWHSLMTVLVVLFSTSSSGTSSTCLSVHLLTGSVAILISPYRQSFFKNIDAKHIPPSYFTFTLSGTLLHAEERKVGYKALVKFSKLPCMNIPQWNCAAMQKSLEIWFQLAEACQNTRKKNYIPKDNLLWTPVGFHTPWSLEKHDFTKAKPGGRGS